MENHELTDFRHQLCNQLLVKYGWFQVRLRNTKDVASQVEAIKRHAKNVVLT